jgi:hypothetical protein
VKRVGAVDTIAVAFPGAFGVVADRLPVAVAREFGVTDRRHEDCDREYGARASLYRP